MAGIRDVIASKSRLITERFVARLFERRLVAESMSAAEIIDGLAPFVDDIVRALDHSRVSEGRTLASARAHGLHRLKQGFDLSELLVEYDLFAEVLFEVIAENAESLSVREAWVLGSVLASAVRVAATEYVARRDEETGSQTEKHFAFIAHELRNPLTSARLALARLERKARSVPPPTLPPQARASLTELMGDSAYETIDRSMQRLQALIDGSLVSLQRGVMAGRHSTVRREPISLPSLIRGVCEDVAVDATEREVTLECDVPELSVLGDQDILYSAMSNLTRNAVKFTRQGGRVVVRVRAVADAVHVEVEDQCGGLPPESMEKIFDPFVQVGEDRSGFGLGLAITKHAALAHGGAVHVRNIEGKGCMFVLELPLPKTP